MNPDVKRGMTFPLRLSLALKESANILARQDGISLNVFISLAVAEKITRLESETLLAHQANAKQRRLALAVDSISHRLSH